MAEKPIIFSGPMVRAILDGSKTMTRRVVKIPSKVVKLESVGFTGACPPGLACARGYHASGEYGDSLIKCPYEKGDTLWVRESFGRHISILELRGYAADGWIKTESHERLAPAIHMPRCFSRITLEVVSVKVERLQDISDGDAIREGVIGTWLPYDEDYEFAVSQLEPGQRPPIRKKPSERFQELWDSINGKREGYSWADNPWVWAIEFKRVNP